jgi:hypothetical protein
MIQHVETAAEMMFGRSVAQWTTTAVYSLLFAVSSSTGVAYAAGDNAVPERQAVRMDIITITAVLTASVTLIASLANAAGTYRITIEKTKLDAEERRFNRTMELRLKTFEARVNLAKAGITCHVSDCPITCEIGLPVGNDSPILQAMVEAKPDEPTVDLP